MNDPLISSYGKKPVETLLNDFGHILEAI